MMVMDHDRSKEPDLSMLLLTDKNKTEGREYDWCFQYYISLNNRYEPMIFKKLFNFRIKETAVSFGTYPAKALRFFSVVKEEFLRKGGK